MAKGNSVIQMYTSAVQDAAASIDMQDDGVILKAVLSFDMTSIAADGDGALMELSFGSTNANSSNDARQVIARLSHIASVITAASAIVGTARGEYDFGDDGLPFFGGERLYIHTGNLVGGLFTRGTAHLLIAFKNGPISRRR